MEFQPLIEELSSATAEGIWFQPSWSKEELADGNQYVVDIIPGNPCLMTYYEPFLSTLFGLLNENSSSRAHSAHVGGYTLPGFEFSPDKQRPGVKLPASLRSQISHTEDLIKVALESHLQQDQEDGSHKRPRVILVTHSVGAYIALEILRRRAQGQNELGNVDIVGGVFICPTVTNIAQSRDGAIVNVRLSH
jgi:pimeloyl-ACP methyl ester carboxylesterase